MMAGCATVTYTIETASDWRAAGLTAGQAVDAFTAQRDIEAVNVSGWGDNEVIAAAVRDGACAMVYGIIDAKRRGEASYLECARYGMQVAGYWVSGRYPALGRDWIDLLLEHRASLEYAVGRLGNHDLERGTLELLAWLDTQGRQKSVMLPLLLRPAAV
jgi:hypothetical protein